MGLARVTAPRKGCHGRLVPRTPPAPSPACLIRLPCTNHDKQPCTACRPRDTGEGSSSTHGQIPCDSYRWSFVSSPCGHLAVRSASWSHRPHDRAGCETKGEKPKGEKAATNFLFCLAQKEIKQDFPLPCDFSIIAMLNTRDTLERPGRFVPTRSDVTASYGNGLSRTRV